MNPVIVIPSYWASADEPGELGELGTYDHATPYDKPMPELETCLDSLEQVRGVVRVVVLVVAPLAGETAASVLADDPALILEEHRLLKEALDRYISLNERKIVL